MQLSRGPRIPRPIPWASLRRTAAFRSPATRRSAATGGNPNCARKLRVAASRTAYGRKAVPHSRGRLRQLELKLEQSAQPAAHKMRRKERERRDIEEVFDEYWNWIQDSMSTEREPWLKVICAIVGDG